MTRVAHETTIDLTEAVEDPGLTEFASAGSKVSGEFRCADCGYGAVVQQVLPPCPMCRGTVWARREAKSAR
jgi:hypothetical protein